MTGTEEQDGIVQYSVRDIFKHIQRHPEVEFKVTNTLSGGLWPSLRPGAPQVQASFLEIYNEQIADLLSGHRQAPLGCWGPEDVGAATRG